MWQFSCACFQEISTTRWFMAGSRKIYTPGLPCRSLQIPPGITTTATQWKLTLLALLKVRWNLTGRCAYDVQERLKCLPGSMSLRPKDCAPFIPDQGLYSTLWSCLCHLSRFVQRWKALVPTRQTQRVQAEPIMHADLWRGQEAEEASGAMIYHCSEHDTHLLLRLRNNVDSRSRSIRMSA